MTDRPEDERPSGPLDTTTLEVLGRRAGSHPLVCEWRFRPDSVSPRHLELRLDATQYPSTVTSARLDVRWFEGGDYSVHYLEQGPSTGELESWQCRWDRHPRPEAPRAHFHPPPDGGAGVEPSPIGGDEGECEEDHHHLDVLFAVFDWVDDRLRDVHR
ncbi:hypothetical protein OB955_10535 [Halobacteria archaeon AArc-m2/3/4]|uniref:FHA domain-containing protein n=1 Tax=Natronoglomus mannanivorans TaxID=2979990 RepID=A0ABT2QE32_9EURY|nr:hypothetical protein [Halobacteria archaeon AArc-m2/3/4]